jgi:ParB-like chromosome segregation protein Spo0J
VSELVDLALIDVGPRLRPSDPMIVAALAASMEAEGQLQPIGLVRSTQRGERFTLIWGLHRRDAALMLNWSQVEAKVYLAKDLPDALDRLQLEALENLARAELAPYDRAVTVAGLRDVMLRSAGLAEGQSAKALGGMARHDDSATANFAVADLAARVGRSKRSVEDDLWLAERLQPALATAARGRDGWRNASVVTACAKLALEQQMQLIGWLSANLEGSLKDALGTLAPDAVSTPSDKATKAVLGNFERVRTQDRVAVLGQLCEALTPGQRKELLVALDSAWQEDAKQALAGSAVGGDA